MKRIKLLLLLVFIQSASAWTLAGEDITFNGETFQTTINPDWDIITIQAGNDLLIIDEGKCESTAYYRVCFKEARWDFQEGWGEYDPITEEKIPEINVEIESLMPEVEIRSEITESNLLLNEETLVKIEIENKGSKRIDNVKFSSTVPIQLSFSDIKGAVKNGRNIEWQASSLATEHTITYQLKVDIPVNVSYGSKVSYSYEAERFEVQGGNINVKTVGALNPLKMQSSISKSEPKVGEWVSHHISLSTQDVSTRAELELEIPKEIDVDSIKELEREEDKLVWEGQVNKNSPVELSYRLRNTHSGSHEITGDCKNIFYNDVENRYLNGSQEISEQVTFSVDKIEPEIRFMQNKHTLQTGNKSYVIIRIENKDDKVGFFDINYSLKSRLLGNSHEFIDLIGPGEEKTIFYRDFVAPSVVNDTDFIINVSGRYRTQYYEYFKFSETETLTVKKDPEALPIPVEDSEDAEPILQPNVTQEDINTTEKESSPFHDRSRPRKIGFFQRLLILISSIFT